MQGVPIRAFDARIRPQAWTIAAPARHSGTAVWHVDLADVPGNVAAFLSADEHARAARFLRVEDRERFLRSHGVLRLILGAYLGRPPAELAFRTEPNGRPELTDPASGLRFNLSHSGHHALVGVAHDVCIGVDVEVLRPFPDVLAVARAHFHPAEMAALEALPERARAFAFFACWTRKEAVVKALGVGLSLPLDRFRVSLPPDPAAVLGWEQPAPSPGDWSLHHLEPAEGVLGCVAIGRADAPCARFRLALATAS